MATAPEDNSTPGNPPGAPPPSDVDQLSASAASERIAATSTPQSPSESAGADEISMENLDQLLGESDPTFSAAMQELGENLSDADVQISSSPARPAPEEGAKSHRFLRGPLAKIPLILSRLRPLLQKMVLRSKESSVVALHESLGQAQEIRSVSTAVLKQYKGRDWKIIALFCFTLLLMGFAYTVVQPILDQWLKGDFFGNYNKVADQIVELGPQMKMQSFRDPLEEFNFIVQYERMVVNLKPSLNSTSNPMATFVIYAEGTSRDTAVELKDRQMEIRDICQRVAEGLTYDEFVSAEGKRRFKNLVRKEVNEILNAGRLRAIYFDTVIVKP